MTEIVKAEAFEAHCLTDSRHLRVDTYLMGARRLIVGSDAGNQ
jgi:hypothetical protein